MALTIPFVDLTRSTQMVRDAFLSDLEVLLGQTSFVNGPRVVEFEQAFAASCGRKHCVGLASGLDALRLGLIASGVEAGDEVIVPAMTFVATFEAVAQAGATPVVADVREDDVGLDPEAVSSAIGPKTRFLMPVHLYGQMVDWQALRELADRHDLVVLEDACQAHGASRDGARAGAVGQAAAFSFYPSKNLGAMGDAGALVTDDDDVARVVRALREHGESQRYFSERIGYTARLDAIQALVLSHKLPHLETWNAERRHAAELYTAALADVGDLRLPTTVPGAHHVWHLYTVRTVDPVALAEHLAARGIGTGRHYPQPPHLSTAFAYLGLGPGSFPVAEAIARETLSLPLFPGITAAQVAEVADAVAAFFAGG